MDDLTMDDLTMDDLDSTLTIQDAHLQLKQFDCLRGPSSIAPLERSQLRQALLQVASQSDYQMLGVCADTLAEGQQALETYATALGYGLNCQLESIDGPVYIKFNPNAQSCYASPYAGNHRGVLVSCQSADATGLNEMYGHLPLDLFV